ncbi:hypothetical protein M3G91_09280 [Micromonospora chalcea]|uniref:hypothetical protein n=1 Tax=Micromonospora chalcea TaxID=1874 RepID=UPI0021A3EA35|nr:hypothetical protein [Micromonospora chalcea]MCT2277816.1 hypothetical protein [Micromonospora chalcea]
MSSEADVLDWDDVGGAVRPIVEIWVSGSELRWARHAWALLGKAGLTSYASEVERTRCLLRAVAIGRLYREFCARAFDEGSPGDWREYVGSDLVGDYPLIDAFTLGQLVEREGIEVDNAPFDDGLDVNEALRDLVELEYPKVFGALRSQSGDAELFASLFVSPELKIDYPLSDEQVSEAVNFEVTANKMVGWEWLTGGDPQ